MELSYKDVQIIEGNFDQKYYRSEYPDTISYDIEPLIHFCAIGWREGRNPNPFFDTATYLLDYPDVRLARINPYLHFLTLGLQEGRRASSSVSPSVRSRLLLGAPIHDWVDRLKPIVDVDYYLRLLDPDMRELVNPVAHFAYLGWREGLAPSASIDLAELLLEFPRAQALLVNPILALQDVGSGRSVRSAESVKINIVGGLQGPSPDQETIVAEIPAPANDVSELVVDTVDGAAIEHEGVYSHALELVRTGFNSAYYLANNNDVVRAKIDPLEHYFQEGWKEGRNPARTFNTKYYLDANEDVRRAGINPYWHFLASGQKEGRLGKKPDGYRRSLIDAAKARSVVKTDYGARFDAATPDAIDAILAKLKKAKSNVVSISHDCYLAVTGGTQIFLADEQKAFNALGTHYLQLSPLSPQLKLVEWTRDDQVILVFDGQLVGIVSLSDLDKIAQAIGNRHRVMASQLIIHCALGWDIDYILGLKALMQPKTCRYWLHDYSSLCSSVNLLRNDVQYCAAPAVSSMACRVCVYGAERAEHLARMQTLFAACDFEVIAPSKAALEVWAQATNLTYKSAVAHPHWHIEESAPLPKRSRAAAPSVAFLGWPSANKGWQNFAEMAEDDGLRDTYEFYQFSSATAPKIADIHFVETEVTSSSRYAAVDLLKKHQIDIVAMLAPWPETFSYVVHEAIAAGCQVICLKNSGNVARIVQSTGRGLVFDTEAALTEFLKTRGLKWALSSRQKRISYRIDNCGTTATYRSASEGLSQ